MAFNSEQRTIGSKLLGQTVYTVPRNQRKYVWEEKNWNELWNDINFLSAIEDKAHFVGSIVLMDNGEVEGIHQYEIIDGQQRIITLILLTAAIMQYYKEHTENDSYLGLKRFLISTDLRNNDLCKIQSEYQPSIEDIIKVVCNPDDQTTKEQMCQRLEDVSDSLIPKCFKFFCDKIASLQTDEVQRIQRGVLRTTYIEIIATTEEDSYTIFEILNARGMELEDYELLKNYIMRYTIPVANIDRVKSDWSNYIETPLGAGLNRFLIHYARHKYKTSGTIDAYNTLKQNNNASTINSLFTDLKQKAKFYKKIYLPVLQADNGDCTAVEYRVFKFLRANRGELFRPVILSLMSQKHQGNLSNNDYEKVLIFLQYYFTCYNLILQETSNKISDGIQKYAYLLENEYSRANLCDFIQYLISKMPGKKVFIRAFGSLGWSHTDAAYDDSSRKRKVQIALSMLEAIKSSLNHIPDFTIEHINPDSAAGNNAMIGNLLPLESNLNGNCQDKTVNEKIPYYQQSNFRITREFAAHYIENAGFDPKNRADLMAKMIYSEFENTSRAFKR